MSILTRPRPEVQPDWHTSEPTPLDLLIAPAEAPCPCEPDQARYAVRERFSPALGRTIFEVIDRAEDGRMVAWYAVRANAVDHAADLVAEDHEPVLVDGLPWYQSPLGFEGWDRPVRLASLPSQARADRTIDRLGLVEFPPF